MIRTRIWPWAMLPPVTLLLLAVSATSLAQSAPYTPQNPYADPWATSQPPAAENPGFTTVEGTVTGLGLYKPFEDAPQTLRIGMTTDDGRALTAQASPGYRNLNVGDRIKAQGTWSTIDGVPILLASNIQQETALNPPPAGYSNPEPPAYAPPPYPEDMYPYYYGPGDYWDTLYPAYWWPGIWWGQPFVGFGLGFDFGFDHRFHNGDRFGRFDRFDGANRAGRLGPTLSGRGTARWQGMNSSSFAAHSGALAGSTAGRSTWTGTTNHSTWTGTTNHSTTGSTARSTSTLSRPAFSGSSYHAPAYHASTYHASVSHGGWSGGSRGGSSSGYHSGRGGSRGGGRR